MKRIINHEATACYQPVYSRAAKSRPTTQHPVTQLQGRISQLTKTSVAATTRSAARTTAITATTIAAMRKNKYKRQSHNSK